MMEIMIAAGIALGVGLVMGWLLAAKGNSSRLGLLEGELAGTRQQIGHLTDQVRERQSRLELANGESARDKQRIGQLTQQIADQQQALAEQKKLLDDAQQKLQDTFKVLAAEALKISKEDFLQLAKESLQTLMTQTRGDLGKHKEQIDALVNPLRETLTTYQKNLQEIENARRQAYGNLTRHLEELGKTHQELRGRTSELATALKNPRVGGRWGELTLRRVAELAGMSDYCDFEEQVTTEREDERLRPDMIVHLPGGRMISVDSKLSYQSYLDAMNAPDGDSRLALLRKYSETVRGHVRKLGGRSYWEQFKNNAVDLVVLFLPGECFFSAAVLEDRNLIEDAMSNRVILASPTTLIALLRAVAYGWRQEKLAESAEKIHRLGQELFDRIINYVEPMSDLAKHLRRTVESYNQAIGSLESRLLPTARKFSDLGVGENDKLPEMTTVDLAVRQPPTPNQPESEE